MACLPSGRSSRRSGRGELLPARRRQGRRRAVPAGSRAGRGAVRRRCRGRPLDRPSAYAARCLDLRPHGRRARHRRWRHCRDLRCDRLARRRASLVDVQALRGQERAPARRWLARLAGERPAGGAGRKPPRATDFFRPVRRAQGGRRRRRAKDGGSRRPGGRRSRERRVSLAACRSRGPDCAPATSQVPATCPGARSSIAMVG